MTIYSTGLSLPLYIPCHDSAPVSSHKSTLKLESHVVRLKDTDQRGSPSHKTILIALNACIYLYQPECITGCKTHAAEGPTMQDRSPRVS